MDELAQIKSFWDRTEGKVGKAAIALLTVGGSLFLWNYSTELVAMLQNTVQAMVLIGTIVGLLALATSQQVHNAVSALFKIVMYNLTNMIVAIDPIAVAKGQIQEAKKIRARMDGLLEDFRAQVKGLQDLIRQNQGKIKMANQYMFEAKQQIDKTPAESRDSMEVRHKRKAMILNARTASRKEQSNRTYQDLLALAERILKQLTAARDSADLLIEDKVADIEEREQRYKMSKTVIGVVRRAMQLRGALQDNELYDLAVEKENEQFAQAIGMLENFTDASADFIATADLSQGIFEADAMRRIEEEMARRAGNIDQIILRDGTSGSTRREEAKAGTGYDNLFR